MQHISQFLESAILCSCVTTQPYAWCLIGMFYIRVFLHQPSKCNAINLFGGTFFNTFAWLSNPSAHLLNVLSLCSTKLSTSDFVTSLLCLQSRCWPPCTLLASLFFYILRGHRYPLFASVSFLFSSDFRSLVCGSTWISYFYFLSRFFDANNGFSSEKKNRFQVL